MDAKGMVKEPTVTIKISEWKRLQKDSYKLDALESTGVGNWDGYDEAMSEYRKTMKDVDLDKEVEAAREAAKFLTSPRTKNR